MQIRTHKLNTEQEGINIRFCLVADLHSKKYQAVLDSINEISPDAILCAGDILERLDGYCDEQNKNGFEFLEKAARIAPTYYSFGNHELFGGSKDRCKFGSAGKKISAENFKKLKSTGVKILDDDYVTIGNLHIGGLSSGLYDKGNNLPNLEFTERFAGLGGYKILMSHHPEYFEKYLMTKDIDLVLSGHAHGGQWRIFGKGIYAPQQGLFPKYTSGIYGKRFIVSRGVANSVAPIPRFFNPCEIVVVEVNSRNI